MDESLVCYVEQKTPDTKEYILYDSIFMNVKNKQNEAEVTEVRTAVTWRGEGLTDGKKHKEAFCNDGKGSLK